MVEFFDVVLGGCRSFLVLVTTGKVKVFMNGVP